MRNALIGTLAFLNLLEFNDVVLIHHQEVMVAGGMESMSNVPFLVGRDPPKYGGHTMEVGSYVTKTTSMCSHKPFLPDGPQHLFGAQLENVTGPKRFSGPTSMTQLMAFSMYQA